MIILESERIVVEKLAIYKNVFPKYILLLKNDFNLFFFNLEKLPKRTEDFNK